MRWGPVVRAILLLTAGLQPGEGDILWLPVNQERVCVQGEGVPLSCLGPWGPTQGRA